MTEFLFARLEDITAVTLLLNTSTDNTTLQGHTGSIASWTGSLSLSTRLTVPVVVGGTLPASSLTLQATSNVAPSGDKIAIAVSGVVKMSVTAAGIGIGADAQVGVLDVRGLINGLGLQLTPSFGNASYILSVSPTQGVTSPFTFTWGSGSSPWTPPDANNSYAMDVLIYGQENTNDLTGLRVAIHKIAPSTAGGSTVGANISATAETGLTYTGNPNKDALIGMDLNVIAHSKVDSWAINTTLLADVATNNLTGWELDVGSSVSAKSKWLYVAQSTGVDTGTISGTQIIAGGSGDTVSQSAAFIVTASGSGFAQGIQFIQSSLSGSTAPVTAHLMYGGGFSVPYGVNFGRMTFSQAAMLLPNGNIGGVIKSFNAAGNTQIPLLSLNVSNQIALGAAVTIDPTTGAMIAGTITAPRLTLAVNGIGATTTDAGVLQNSTVAAAGAQQWSPRIRLTGQGWKTNTTAGSQQVDWAIEAAPVQGTANPSVNLLMSSQINGGGFTTQLSLTSGGILSTSLGYQINLANASTGHVLRGDGTKFIDGVLAAADLSNGTTGSGLVVLATSPTLATPILGVATATSLNGNTFTTGTYTLTGVAAKTLTFNNTLTLAGTDATTITFQGTDTYMGRTTTDTMTNKTFDTAATGNVFKINGTTITANTGTGSNVLGTSPSITTPTIVGDTTGGAAGAGNVGQDVSQVTVVGSAITLTTGTAANVATIVNLPAGDWEISGAVYYSPAATTNVTITNSSTSVTSAVNDTAPGKFHINAYGSSGLVTGGGAITAILPPMRVSTSAAANYYLVGFAGFTVSTLTAYGEIHARRMR